jgi:hypothetical protein
VRFVGGRAVTRPRLEVRDVLANATRELVSQGRPGVTWREVAAHVQAEHKLSHELARQTMNNMARAGELARVDSVSTPGARRPMTLYAPASPEAAAAADEVPPLMLLDDVLRGWLPGPPGG